MMQFLTSATHYCPPFLSTVSYSNAKWLLTCGRFCF